MSYLERFNLWAYLAWIASELHLTFIVVMAAGYAVIYLILAIVAWIAPKEKP